MGLIFSSCYPKAEPLVENRIQHMHHNISIMLTQKEKLENQCKSYVNNRKRPEAKRILIEIKALEKKIKTEENQLEVLKAGKEKIKEVKDIKKNTEALFVLNKEMKTLGIDDLKKQVEDVGDDLSAMMKETKDLDISVSQPINLENDIDDIDEELELMFSQYEKQNTNGKKNNNKQPINENLWSLGDISDEEDAEEIQSEEEQERKEKQPLISMKIINKKKRTIMPVR